MADRTARIKVTNLPLRPRQLKPGELQNVFGGCMGPGGPCAFDSDCCPGHYCDHGGLPFYCLKRW